MTARNPTLADVITQAMETRLSDLHVALPAQVMAYDPTLQTVDVKPMLTRVIETDTGELPDVLPVIPAVPVAFPRAGNFFVSFPIKPGDFVLLVFVERSMDEWWATGVEALPGDLRKHSLADAVAIPGVYPATLPIAPPAHATNMVLGTGPGQVHITPAGEVRLGLEAAVSFVALAQAVDTELTAVKADLEALKTLLSTHVHTGVTTGAGASGPSADFASYTPHTPATVAATKVKAI